MQYKLTKIRAHDPIVSTSRRSAIGEFDSEPRVGKPFTLVIGGRDSERGIITSTVVEVYKRDNGSYLFQTARSVYELTPVGMN